MGDAVYPEAVDFLGIAGTSSISSSVMGLVGGLAGGTLGMGLPQWRRYLGGLD